MPGHRRIPVVLSIAGSDCSGGAGIQADIKTCSALGAYCATVITAVTAQNPERVLRVDYVGDGMLCSQLEAVLKSITPDAVKIGMIPCPEAVGIIHEFLCHAGTPIVIDPVLAATSGAALAGEKEETVNGTISEMRRLLFPISTLVTPNIPELYRISGASADISPVEAARDLMDQCGMNAMLVKGGHASGDSCDDILVMSDGSMTVFSGDRIATKHTHGTGCTLSSAIAATLAKGYGLQDALKRGKDFVTMAISHGRETGLFETNGPVMQF